VREGARSAYDRIDEIPECLRNRTISLRAFDRGHMLVNAGLQDGRERGTLIGQFFADPAVAYLQAHCAYRGCFAARIERA
jgi:hypothetical protein